MRFKFLHVIPHVWFYKQKETLGKSPGDDNSSEPALVYKRSTSLRLIRSGSSAESLKGNPSEGKPKSNTSVQGRLSNEILQKQGKEIRICTVVDAGCTCRATMTSQHKQKKEAGGYTDARGDGSGHGRRLPRLHCVSESGSSASTSSNNMVSRLVCKSMHDVVKQSTEAHEVKHCNAVYVGEETAAMGTQKACLDVDELECRLRNAGLEERRRKKKTKSYEECSTNTNISGSVSTNTNIVNTNIVNTATSSEIQEGFVVSEINFDGMDSSSMGNNMITLAGLRASLAQRKLSKHRLINQASHHGGKQQLIDHISDRLVSNEQLSIDGQKVIAVAPSLPLQEFVVDVGISKDLSQGNLKAPFDYHGLNQPKACNDKLKLKLLYEEETPSSALIRRPRKLKSSPNNVISREKAYELTGEHGRRIVSNRASAQFASNQGGIEPQLDPNQRGAQPHLEVTNGAESRLEGDYHDDGDEEKQVVSSSSCEIQVPSDYYDNHDDDYDGMISMVSGSSLSSAGELHHGLMSSGAVAMVKSSYDPHNDFKESMVEMVVAKQLRGPRQLHQLLQCYLSLNPEEYHAIIIKVFHDLCSDLLH